MSQKDIDYYKVKEVVDDLDQVFATKDVSEDKRMISANRQLARSRNYHAFVGRFLSAHRAELDIEEIRKKTPRGSVWRKTPSPID